MKKTKIIAFICVLSMLLSCVQFVATASYQNIPDMDNNILMTIKNYSDNENVKIVKKIPLHNTNNAIVAYCYLLSPEGYAVFDLVGCMVESGTGNDKVYESIVSSADKIMYYAGPFDFFIQTNGQYKNIITEYNYTFETIETACDNFATKANNISQASISHSNDSTQGVKVYYTLSGSMRNYSHNPNGICAATASAIALMYYRDHIDSSVVRDWLVSSDGIDLIEFLAPQMHGSLTNPVGATLANVVSGLGYYFRYYGLQNKYSALSASASNKASAFSNMKNIIQSNRPIILLINSHPVYGNHYITVYEIFQDVGFLDAYYVNAKNGWGGTATVSLNYATGYVYLNR